MALRAGSVGLGREAGLGARRGWTRRRRPPHARGSLFPRPGPAAPGPVVVAASRARVWLSRLFPLPGVGREAAPRVCAGVPGGGGGGGFPAGFPRTRGRGVPSRAPGGPAAAATLDASRALPVDRPSCGGRRGRPRGARRAPRARRGGGACACVRARAGSGVPPFPRRAAAAAPRPRPSPAAGARSSPAGSAPGGPVPRGASPRPAPSSRLRTGADQGNPTV